MKIIANIVEAPNFIASFTIAACALFCGQEQKFVCIQAHFCLTNILENSFTFLDIVSSSPTETIIAARTFFPMSKSVVSFPNDLLMRGWCAIHEVHSGLWRSEEGCASYLPTPRIIDCLTKIRILLRIEP